MSITSSCRTKQTFCALNGQTVSNQSSLKFTTSTCVSGQKVLATQFNELVNELVKIYNFGTRGTRTPTNTFNLPLQNLSATTAGSENSPSQILNTTNINSILKSSGNQITAADYNKILTAISQTNKSIGQLLGTTFADTITAINNYSINANRCDNCNISCNTYAQNYCDCDCDCYCDCDCSYCNCDCNCCGQQGEYCCGYD